MALRSSQMEEEKQYIPEKAGGRSHGLMLNETVSDAGERSVRIGGIFDC